MTRFKIHIAIFSALILLAVSGCGYFNTFYNARKLYHEAERDTRTQEKRTQQQQHGATPQNNPSQADKASPAPNAPGQSGAASDKYRRVIETSSRMLEDYPKSRWAAEALFIMGVSYYRLGDLPRAERKFTELISNFPKSRFVPSATLWKARSLAAEKKRDEAIEVLQSGLELIGPGPEKANALFVMGTLFSDEKRLTDAADYFRQAALMPQAAQDRLNAIYSYAETEFALDSCLQARDAYAEVASKSRDVRQAYNAYIHCSECEVRLHNYDRAEAILQHLQSGERFLDYADEVPLELAQLAVTVGKVDEGMRLYEDFIRDHANGEERGLAFYRLALIHRDQRVDLTQARSLLDSCARSGASREIADSAHAALDEITRGLGALGRITSVQESIQSLRAQADSEGIPREALSANALLALEDSVRQREAAAKPKHPVEVLPADTAQLALQLPLADTVAKVSPPLSAATVKETAKQVAHAGSSLKSIPKPVPQYTLAVRTTARADSDAAWEVARQSFHAMLREDRFGLLRLTDAIAMRDSVRDAGADEHMQKVQTIINRAYGIGELRTTATADSLRVGTRIPPQEKKAIAGSAPDSLAKDSLSKTESVLPIVPKVAADTLKRPARVDTLPRPASSDSTKPPDSRHSNKGYRSTADSPGDAPPDSMRKPQAPDTTQLHPPSASQSPQDTVTQQITSPNIPVDSAPAAAVSDTSRLDSTTIAIQHPNSEVLRTQLLARERELQLAYLHAAEFYVYSFGETDSALAYYQLAASSPVNADVYWRANLYLGNVYSVKPDSGGSDSARTDSLLAVAAAHFHAVVDADSVPVAAANTARAALKMPLIELPLNPQDLALRAAEKARFADGAPVDSVLDLYSHVITMDPASRPGKMALFAKATLLETSLHRADQARAAYEGLLKLNPDSAMASIARGKLAKPDTTSIFLLTDDQLSGKRAPVESLFDKTKDKSGWPPAEDELRGRHFR